MFKGVAIAVCHRVVRRQQFDVTSSRHISTADLAALIKGYAPTLATVVLLAESGQDRPDMMFAPFYAALRAQLTIGDLVSLTAPCGTVNLSLPTVRSDREGLLTLLTDSGDRYG